jgi:serine phosphatase RsbU (regulator of sigma subunit)
MILPKPEELAKISGLEIDGFMEAANEVGGDYYDIIQADDRLMVGIGDVTGHGLESGVLMIMAQTAVRTLSAALDGRDSHQLLNALNRVVYDNAQQMGSSRHLTLSLLDYSEGELIVTGQHEEIIVVRSSGELERVDTVDLGFPVGMVENISDFIAQQRIQLEIGDGVVLYTDEITEAENAQREFYGLERMLAVIPQHWHLSVREIRSAIVEDVRSHIGSHTVYDDITLVVLKRNS